MVMGKIINQSELIYDACCPEVPTPEYDCLAVITDVAITETFDVIVTTNGSQAGAQAGSVIRVGVTSEIYGNTFYLNWEPCGVNVFTLPFADIGNYMMSGDMQIIVQTSTNEGETICAEFTSQIWYYQFDITQSEGDRFLEFQSFVTPGFECTGTVTHEIIYFKGQVFNANQLSIDETGNGYLKMSGEMLADQTMICIVAFYCDGVFQGWLTLEGHPMMFNVRLELVDVRCSNDLLEVTINLVNVDESEIPLGAQFLWTMVTDPNIDPPSTTMDNPFVFPAAVSENGTVQLYLAYDNPGCLPNTLTFTITQIPSGYANFTPEELELIIALA